jgi:hypothetical protein
MTNGSEQKAIVQYAFLHVFANDRTIDAGELAFLERLALRDSVVDDNERATLRTIFARVTKDAVTADVWDEIERFRGRHGI